MNLTTGILEKYMLSNPALEIEVNFDDLGIYDKRQKLKLDPETNRIILSGVDREQFLSISEQVVSVDIYQEDQIGVSSSTSYTGKLDATVVRMAKDRELIECVSAQVKGLLAPAITMCKHYSLAHPKGQPTRCKLYVLRDLAFYSAFKGHAILVPNIEHNGNRDYRSGDPHVIKGYVYTHDGEIRYETVQRWRYAEVNADSGLATNPGACPSAFATYSMLPEEWKTLLLW